MVTRSSIGTVDGIIEGNVMSKSNKKNDSAIGVLINTFGTLLLLTMIAICTLNFIRDGRVYKILADKASAKASDVSDNKKDTSDVTSKENTGSSQKDTGNKSSSKEGSKSSSKAAASQKATQKSAGKQTSSSSKGTGETAKKPVLPGEEP
jgi:hypothetical protein